MQLQILDDKIKKKFMWMNVWGKSVQSLGDKKKKSSELIEILHKG